jgi:hypothetical protein
VRIALAWIAAAAFCGVAPELAGQTQTQGTRPQLKPTAEGPNAAAEYQRILLQEMQCAAQLVKLIESEARIDPSAESRERVAEAKAAALELQRVVVAFEAGLLPRQPQTPPTEEASKARLFYRSLLEQEVDLQSGRDAKTGGESRIQALALDLRKQFRILRAQGELAAFDAGFAVSPPAMAALMFERLR